MLPDIEAADLDEDITSALRIVKKAVAGFELIVTQAENRVEPSPQIARILEESKELLGISQRVRAKDLTSNVMFLPLYERHFDRLRLRLREWLATVKGKYGSCNFRQVKNFLQNLEVLMSIFDKNNDLDYFLSRVYSSMLEQLRLLKIKYGLALNKTVYSDQQLQLRKVKSVGGQKGISMVADAPRVNLSSLYCLDLDYSGLRSLIMSARRNEVELIQAQVERNRPLLRSVQRFARDHYFYSHRPKIRTKVQLYASGFKKQVTGRNIRVKTVANQKNPITLKKEKYRQRSYLKENIPDDSSRAVIKINNVYVSGNQFDMYGESGGIKYAKLQHHSKRKATIFLTRALRDPLTLKINNDEISGMCHA